MKHNKKENVAGLCYFPYFSSNCRFHRRLTTLALLLATVTANTAVADFFYCEPSSNPQSLHPYDDMITLSNISGGKVMTLNEFTENMEQLSSSTPNIDKTKLADSQWYFSGPVQPQRTGSSGSLMGLLRALIEPSVFIEYRFTVNTSCSKESLSLPVQWSDGIFFKFREP